MRTQAEKRAHNCALEKLRQEKKHAAGLCKRCGKPCERYMRCLACRRQLAAFVAKYRAVEKAP